MRSVLTGESYSPTDQYSFWHTICLGWCFIGKFTWAAMVFVAERPRLIPGTWFVLSTPLLMYYKGLGRSSGLDLFVSTYFDSDVIFWLGAIASMIAALVLMSNPPISVQLATFTLMIADIVVIIVVLVGDQRADLPVQYWLLVSALICTVLGGMSAMVLLVRLVETGRAIPDAILDKRGIHTTIR